MADRTAFFAKLNEANYWKAELYFPSCRIVMCSPNEAPVFSRPTDEQQAQNFDNTDGQFAGGMVNLLEWTSTKFKRCKFYFHTFWYPLESPKKNAFETASFHLLKKDLLNGSSRAGYSIVSNGGKGKARDFRCVNTRIYCQKDKERPSPEYRKETWTNNNLHSRGMEGLSAPRRQGTARPFQLEGVCSFHFKVQYDQYVFFHWWVRLRGSQVTPKDST